MQFIQLYVKLI